MLKTICRTLVALTAVAALAAGTSAAGEDATLGRSLFVGSVPFANGGAPCLGCHGLAGLGLAGGASYGPDLSNLFQDYGAEGVAGVLDNLGFPSMEPIYAAHPLTTDEQAALAAFFGEVSGQPAAISKLLLVELLAGVVVLWAVVLLFGRGRLSGVRRSLVEGASKQGGATR